MARQFLLGQRCFEEHFGVACEEVWLPDSFGYTAALPQIVRLAGCRWFLTQKISWNTTNAFPHHTFWWEGIDGTRVFTHFPPVDTYNAELTGRELAHAARNFRDKGAATRSLVPFGYGDGGGGPTREMLGARLAHRVASRARRRSRSRRRPRSSRPPRRSTRTPPVWAGELYLEIHRGTYTSQAAIKQGNRRSEHLLREAELWSATAAVRGLLDYPSEELERLWKTVLLHQFHDILPGSSIAWVHREARATYAAVAARLEAHHRDRASTRWPATATDEVVFNAGPVRAGQGVPGPVRRSRDRPSGLPCERSDGPALENELLRVELDEGGRDPSRARQGDRPRGAAARRCGEPAAAAPRPPRSGTPGTSTAPTATKVTDLDDGDGDGRRRRRGGDPLLRRILSQRNGSGSSATGSGDRDRGRLARAREGPQGGLRRRRARRPRGVRDPVRARRPADPRQHHLGRGPVRGVRAPVGARGRGRVRRRAGQRRDLRPRRHPPSARRRRHVHAGPAEPAARAAVPRPGDRPGPARAAVRAGARRRDRGGRRGGVRAQPAPPAPTGSGRSSRWCSVEGTAYVEAVKLAEDGSGDVVVRLYEPLGARTSVRVRASFEHAR